MNTQSQFVVFAIADYCSRLEQSKKSFERVEDLINVLNSDQDNVSYHLRLYNDVVYPLYADMDEGTKQLDEVIEHFNTIFETEIAITKSETTKKNSFHIVIKNKEGTIHLQKQFWENWNKNHPDYKVDSSVYSNNRVFRLPNQLKPYSGKYSNALMPETRHHVMCGTMQDFLLNRYTGAEMLQIQEPPVKKDFVLSQGLSIVANTDIDKLIDCLSSDRANKYETWIQVGMCLRNIENENGGNLSAWKKFSLKSSIADLPEVLTEKYFKINAKTKEEKGFKIGSLKMWSKQDNPELYKQYFPISCLIVDDDDESECNECISEGILNEAKKKLKQGEKIVFNDTHAGKHAFKLIRDNFKFCKGQLFVKTDNTWSMNIGILESKIRIQITDMGLKSIDRKGNLSNYCGNYSKCEAVRKCVMDYIYSNPDDKFYDLLHTTTIGKICFNNGVYSFTEKRFDLWDSEYIKENPVYSCVKINRDYNPNISCEVKDRVYKSVIEDVFGEHSEKYLHFLARATAGHITDKIWGLFLGSRDCGKGVNVSMTKSALEDYIGEFESNHLLCENFVSTDSKQNGWLIPYQFKRIMYSNELQKDSSGKKIKLNSKIIKSINSGGDQIEARALYGNETQISLQTSMMLMANDVPGASNNDVFEKCLEFKTTRQFKSKEYIQEKIQSCKSDIQRETYQNNFREADTDIKNKTKTQEWADAFIQLIIESYKDVSVFVCNNDEDNGEESICDAIFNLLNITGNQDDFVSNADVKKVFSEMNVSIKVIKSNLLAIKSVKEGRDKSGKERGYKGVKLINSTTNLIDELDD